MVFLKITKIFVYKTEVFFYFTQTVTEDGYGLRWVCVDMFRTVIHLHISTLSVLPVCVNTDGL